MSVILASQEAKIRKIMVQSQPWVNSSTRPYLEKPFTKIGQVEWLIMKALSSSPSTAKKKKKKERRKAKGVYTKYIIMFL
jgi:hypothetical protein